MLPDRQPITGQEIVDYMDSLPVTAVSEVADPNQTMLRVRVRSWVNRLSLEEVLEVWTKIRGEDV